MRIIRRYIDAIPQFAQSFSLEIHQVNNLNTSDPQIIVEVI